MPDGEFILRFVNYHLRLSVIRFKQWWSDTSLKVDWFLIYIYFEMKTF